MIFKMIIAQELLRHVPVGRERATRGSAIWKAYGMWAYSSVRYTLQSLVDAGQIKRIDGSGFGGSVVALFYREAA